MSEIEPYLAKLLTVEPRLAGSDSEIEMAFWWAYPRFSFLKSLPWRARLLDIGAGSGGLSAWRHWQVPTRPDLRLFGVDLQRGAHAEQYEAWETADLDQGLPSFGHQRFDAFLSAHVIEHLADPRALVEAAARVATPGAKLYLEWPNPATKDLPSAKILASEFDFVIETFNFFDDATHRQTPERAEMERLLAESGFRVIEASETRLGMLAEEMIARGRLRDDLVFRQFGLWAAVGWSNVVVAEFAGVA